MNQWEFNVLTRDDLEKLKFVLDSNWDVAVRVVWWGGWGWSTTFLWLTDTDSPYGWAWKIVQINWSNNGLIYWLTVETAVPVWALFTDTTYSVWDGGLTEINFTTAKDTLLSWAEQTSNKNAISWYAGLDASWKINPLQLPALAISETFVVASEVAQLALTVQEWDIAVRTDQNESYIALNDTNATMADWQKLLTPTDAVSSVAWKTWVVTLDSSDVGLWNVENTALSTWTGSANITTLWTITSWTWTWTTIALANWWSGATSLSWAWIVASDPSWVTGADQVVNIMSLTQAEYDAIWTPDASTIYNITDWSPAWWGAWNQVIQTFTAWATIADRDLVTLNVLWPISGNGNVLYIWYSASLWIDHWFEMTWNWVSMSSIWLECYKTWTPADWVIVRIETDNAWEPSGTLADANATSTISWTTIWTTAGVEVTFNFAGAFTLTDWVKYWIVIGRTWALDTNNYYRSQYYNIDSPLSIIKGNKTWSWVTLTWSPSFVCQWWYDSSITPYNSTTAVTLTRALWIAITSATIWNPVNVVIYGVVDWFTWLSKWQRYFPTTTDWVISTSIVQPKIWQAISDTELIFDLQYSGYTG